MEHIHCGRCRQSKPASAFAPSQRRNWKWCRSCYRSWYLERSGGLRKRLCDQCGTSMSVTGRRAAEQFVYCSRACKDRARKDAVIAAREQSKPDRWCRHCGVHMPRSMRSDASYCSAKCNNAAHQLTRRASARSGAKQERIDRAFIIARDEGRCHICGSEPKGSDLTIDHVVPLALGGKHVSENLAVACLSCNCSKGARLLSST